MTAPPTVVVDITGRVPALKAASNGRVWDVDTGHDLMITEPDTVAELLLRVATL